jgi:hypothetical protein
MAEIGNTHNTICYHLYMKLQKLETHNTICYQYHLQIKIIKLQKFELQYVSVQWEWVGLGPQF